MNLRAEDFPDRLTEEQLNVSIPGKEAALCGGCGTVFWVRRGCCPKCSTEEGWVLVARLIEWEKSE